MAFPTLSVKPVFPLAQDGELEDVVLRTPTDAGYEQTRPRFTRARRTWGPLNYVAMPNADVATLRTYEQTTLGNGSLPFAWTHPISKTVYTVRLAGPIKYSRTTVPTQTAVSFTLQEV
jgi:hypothetical protein